MSSDPREQSRPSRAPRIDVRMAAVLTTSDDHKIQVCLHDLSANGFRLSLLEAEELMVGEQVQLRVEGKEVVQAVIRWTAGKEAGGSFTSKQ